MNDISNLFTKNDKPIVFKLPEDVDKKIFEKRILVHILNIYFIIIIKILNLYFNNSYIIFKFIFFFF